MTFQPLEGGDFSPVDDTVNAKRDPVRPEAMRSWCVQKQSIGPKHSDERKERRDRTETLMAIEELGE